MEIKHVIDIMVGVVQIILFMLPLGYMINAAVRKTPLPWFQWVLLSSLLLMAAGIATVAFDYFGLGEQDPLDNCFYTQRLIWGVSDILIYFISLIVGFRIYCLVNTVNHFALEGRLPTQKSIKRNKTILKAIIVFAIVDGVAFVFFNTFWTFVVENFHAAEFFNTVNGLSQVILMLVNCLLYVLAYRLLFNIQGLLQS